MSSFKKTAAQLTLAASALAIAAPTQAERVQRMPHPGEFFDGAQSLGFSMSIHTVATPQTCTMGVAIKETKTGLTRVESTMSIDNQNASPFPFQYSMAWTHVMNGKALPAEKDWMGYNAGSGQIGVRLDEKIPKEYKAVAERILTGSASGMYQYARNYCALVQQGKPPEFDKYVVQYFGFLSDEGLSAPAVRGRHGGHAPRP